MSGFGLASWQRFTTFTCVGTDSSTNTVHRADTFAWYGLLELVSKVLADRNHRLEVDLATCTGSILSLSARRLDLPLVDQLMGQNRFLYVPRPQGFRFKEGFKYSMNMDGFKYSIDPGSVLLFSSTNTMHSTSKSLQEQQELATKVLAYKNHRLAVVIESPRAEATRGQTSGRVNLTGFTHASTATTNSCPVDPRCTTHKYRGEELLPAKIIQPN